MWCIVRFCTYCLNIFSKMQDRHIKWFPVMLLSQLASTWYHKETPHQIKVALPAQLLFCTHNAEWLWVLHHCSPAGANSKEWMGEKQEPTPLWSSHLQKPETSIQVNKATGMATNRCHIVSYVMCQKEYKDRNCTRP